MRVSDSAMRDEQMMTRHHRPRWRRGGHPQLLAFGGGPRHWLCCLWIMAADGCQIIPYFDPVNVRVTEA